MKLNNTKIISASAARKLKKGTKQLKRDRFVPEKVLFDKQLEVLYSPSRYNAITCSRRAGKSFFVAFTLLYKALQHDRCTLLYLANTKKNAVRIMWRVLKNMIDDYSLPFKMNNSTHEITCTATDTLIILGGCKDETEIEAFRGISPSPVYIAIDEAGHFKPYLDQLIQETLRPMLRDYRGRIDLIGTPNPTCTGAFYRAYTGGVGYKDFKPHYWSFFDNPRVPSILAGTSTHTSIMQEEVENTGRTQDDPAVQREFWGRWVKDLESLLYKYNADVNAVDGVPLEEGWRYVLAVDTGYIDNCAYTVMAYHELHKQCYMVQSYKKAFKTVTSIIDEVNSLNEMYHFFRIVFDPAAGGKNMMAELYLRYKLTAESAQKAEKKELIALMNTDILTGNLKVVESGCEDILHEWRNLVWVFNEANGTKEPSTKIGKSKDDHCSDSALYCWRECLHYRSTEPVHDPRSKEDKQADKHVKALVKERQKEIVAENRKLLKRLNRGKRRSRRNGRPHY